MTLILCSQVQERSLSHGGGARENTAPCKVSRDLGLEQACRSCCSLPNTANHKACPDSLGQRDSPPIWRGTAKGMDTGGVRNWRNGRTVITVTTVTNSGIIVTNDSEAPLPPSRTLRPCGVQPTPHRVLLLGWV